MVTIRVVIADDHPPTRALIRHALEEGGCEVVGEAPPPTMRSAGRPAPDVALLDIHMPGSGIHAARRS